MLENTVPSVGKRVKHVAAAAAMGYLISHGMPTSELHAQERAPCHFYDEGDVTVGASITDGNREYRCIGTAPTALGTDISIFRIHTPGRRTQTLTVLEHDYKTKVMRKDFPLEGPDYEMPNPIEFKDHKGNTVACMLNDQLGEYSLCQITSPMDTQEQSKPEVTEVAPSPVPTQEPMTQERFDQMVEAEDKKAESRSKAPEGQCYDSWGNLVPQGDRPGDDNCVEIKDNYPSQGDTTYVFESEPDIEGNLYTVDVTLQQNGTLYWNLTEHKAAQVGPNLLARIQHLVQNIRNIDTIFEGATGNINFSASSDLPSGTELPRGIVTDATLSHYNSVLPIAEKLGYDPRTHLAFIDIETKGRCGQTSDSGAQGCVQIMPTTWTMIRNTINANSYYLQAAQELGINPNTASPWNEKDNIFFSAIYLVYWCKLPTGHIPSGFGLNRYVTLTQHAAVRYHDGHNANVYSPSDCPDRACGVEYIAEIERIIPQFAKAQ